MSLAAEIGNVEMVEILGGFPADAAAGDGEGPDEFDCAFAINSAAAHDHLAVVRYLVDHCRKIAILDDAFLNAVHVGNMEMVGYLIDRNISKDTLQRAMRQAVEKPWDELFRLLLTSADLDQALSSAAGEGRLIMCKALVERGAHDFTDALCRAAEKGHVEVMRYLVDQGANVNGKCKRSYMTKIGDIAMTPIVSALRNFQRAEQTAAVTFLLDKGAFAQSISFGDLETYVVRDSELDLLKRLAARGANLRARNEQGEGLLSSTDDPAVRAFLRSQGATSSWGEHWLHIRRGIKELWSDYYKVLLVPIGLLYLGLSIYFRQRKYRGRPLDNRFGTVNAMLSTAAVCAVALGCVCAAVFVSLIDSHGDSYSGGAFAGAADGGVLIGGAVGLAVGSPTGFLLRNFFKRNKVAYYAFPTTTIFGLLLWAVRGS